MHVPTIPGHPILGHTRAFRDDRVGILTRVAVAHEAARLRLGWVRGIFVLGSPALAHEVLTTKHDAFVKAPGLAIFLRPVLGNGLLTSEGREHAQHRKLLAPAFAHRRVAAYAPTMAEHAARFVDGLRDGEELDAAEAMMRLTFGIVGRTLFDADVSGDASEVGEAVETAMKCSTDQLSSLFPVPPAIPTPTNLRLRRAVARLDRVLYGIIHDRRQKPGDRGDVLSMLLAARDEAGGPMTDTQVRDEAMTLFLAGHETTANALAWTLYLLAQNPEARARVEAEARGAPAPLTYEALARLPYTLAAFKEAMRLYPPAYVVARRAARDVVIGGHPFERGNILLVSTVGLHHRPELFPEPERFLPERFLGDKEKELPRGAYLPFGAGPRVCIGNHFALMEGHVVLATLARGARFDLAPGAKVAMDPLVTLRPKGLRMKVTRLPGAAS